MVELQLLSQTAADSVRVFSKLEKHFDNISFLLLSPLLLSVVLFYAGLSVSLIIKDQPIWLLPIILITIVLLLLKFYMVVHYEAEWENISVLITNIFSTIKSKGVHEARIKYLSREYQNAKISEPLPSKTKFANLFLSNLKNTNNPSPYRYISLYMLANTLSYAFLWVSVVDSVLALFSMTDKYNATTPILFYLLLIPTGCIFFLVFIFNLNIDRKAIKAFTPQLPHFVIVHTQSKDYMGFIVREDERTVLVASLCIEEDPELEEEIRLHRVEFEIPKHSVLSIEKHYILKK